MFDNDTDEKREATAKDFLILSHEFPTGAMRTYLEKEVEQGQLSVGELRDKMEDAYANAHPNYIKQDRPQAKVIATPQEATAEPTEATAAMPEEEKPEAKRTATERDFFILNREFQLGAMASYVQKEVRQGRYTVAALKTEMKEIHANNCHKRPDAAPPGKETRQGSRSNDVTGWNEPAPTKFKTARDYRSSQTA